MGEKRSFRTPLYMSVRGHRFSGAGDVDRGHNVRASVTSHPLIMSFFAKENAAPMCVPPPSSAARRRRRRRLRTPSSRVARRKSNLVPPFNVGTARGFSFDPRAGGASRVDVRARAVSRRPRASRASSATARVRSRRDATRERARVAGRIRNAFVTAVMD